jgi:cytochrome c peroxidase
VPERVNIGSELYDSFTAPVGHPPKQQAKRESIARGEALFDSRVFTINFVAGLNDIKGDVDGTEPGTCSTCHSNLNVGNDTAGDPKRLGIMDNSNGVNVMPATPDFPRFAFYCATGSIPFFSNPVTSPNCPGSTPGNDATCDEFITTDPGKGLVNGKCADLGKMKVPVLRGLASRAPYFHGGNAATLEDVVNFYNKRFNIGFTGQEITDLANYLNSL